MRVFFHSGLARRGLVRFLAFEPVLGVTVVEPRLTRRQLRDRVERFDPIALHVPKHARRDLGQLGMAPPPPLQDLVPRGLSGWNLTSQMTLYMSTPFLVLAVVAVSGRRPDETSGPPDLLADSHDQLELAPLVVLGEVVAVMSAREPALRAQRQLVERHDLRCFVDARS